MKNSVIILILITLFSTNWVSAQCPNSNRAGVHVVQSGENLYRISKRYGISVNRICALNDISPNAVLSPCQELRVSSSASNNAGPPKYTKQSAKRHTVREGESLAQLAALYGYTEARFREINYMKPSDNIVVGSILITDHCDAASSSSAPSTTPPSTPTPFNTPSTTPATPGPQPGMNPPPAPANNLADAKSPSPNAPYMSKLEWSMIDEINLMRGNPAGYVKYIEEYKTSKRAQMIGLNPNTVAELIAQLEKTKPLSILKPAECVYDAAKKHGEDLRQRGYAGHNGSDGSMPWERVKRACPQFQDGNENLVGGPDNVRHSVIILLIDEGIANRGHRRTLLNPHWSHVGCYRIGQVGSMPHYWVQKFAQAGPSTAFEEFNKPSNNNYNYNPPGQMNPPGTPSYGNQPNTNQPSTNQPSTNQPSTNQPYGNHQANNTGGTDSAPASNPADATTPAPNAPYMSKLEWSMTEEINLMRSDPPGYVKYIEEYKTSKRAQMTGLNSSTVEELIAELKNTPKLSILQPAECLYKAAKKHGQDMKSRGKSGHVGSDGSWPWDRVRRECPDYPEGNENLVGGPDKVRHSVIILLIDEGIANRGHRRTLLNPKWTHSACYNVGQVGSMPNSWVQKFGQAGSGSSSAPGGDTGSYNPPSNNNTAGQPSTPGVPSPPKSTNTYPSYASQPSTDNPKGGGSLPASNPADATTPAPNAPYMSKLEWSMADEINLLRSDPPSYIKYIQEYKTTKRAKMTGLTEALVQELIAVLQKTPKLSILKPSECLYNAGKKHGQDMKSRGSAGHVGSDGSMPWDRVRKFCPYPEGNENLVGGPDNVRHSVVILLLDRGVPNRGHRRTLLNPKWTHSACYRIGKLGHIPNYWVQKFGQE